MANVRRRLDLTEPTRSMGERKLLKEGVVSKAKSGRKLRAFLCTDILVLTDEVGKTLYRTVISTLHVAGARNLIMTTAHPAA
jgi:hypothetical protein